MTNDEATRAATSFESFAALEAAARGGYVPSLVLYGDEDPETTEAKTRLVRALRAAGLKVWEGRRAENVRTLRRRYRAVRARCMAMKGEARKGDVSPYDLPGYMDTSAKLSDALKALRKAEKALRKVNPNHPLAEIYTCYSNNYYEKAW